MTPDTGPLLLRAVSLSLGKINNAQHADHRRAEKSRTGKINFAAIVIIWFALIFPDQLSHLTPGALVRLPIEALLLVALALLLPWRSRRTLAVIAGILLGLVAVLKIINLAFFAVLGQPFNPLTDLGYLGSAVGLLRDSTGPVRAVGAVTVGILGLVGMLLLVLWSTLRLTSFSARHRTRSAWTVITLAVGWLLCAALGVQFAGGPVAATVTSVLTPTDSDAGPVAPDPFAATSDRDLLIGLRGRDVLIVFVESYGRVAIEDPVVAPGVSQVLDRGTASLRAAGFSSRSAYLTSPTYAGISWLAHGTLQSGLWIDNQRRYDRLLQGDRLTVSAAFQRAGWRTVAAVPANGEDWPQGSAFYGYDTIYDRRNVGYAGPSFGYASMPDQYTLAALQRNELTRPDRSPVMAEVDLVSSHGPWAPLPRMVDWAAVGDGSVFAGMPAEGQSPEQLAGRPELIKAAYGQSIQYSLTALISFVEHLDNDNLVVIAVGDHQPAAVVSGPDAGRDVPITVIAHDPAVLAAIGSWGWSPGLRPGPGAPVWPMDAFRDRFLTAYGPR